MNVLLFAVPITFFVIIITVVFVITSDSNKYVKNLSNEEQIRLDRLKQEVLNDIQKNNKKNSTSELSGESLVKQLENQSKELDELKTEIVNYKKFYKKQFINTISEKKTTSKKLEFTKENLVRGIIASQYLPKKTRR